MFSAIVGILSSWRLILASVAVSAILFGSAGWYFRDKICDLKAQEAKVASLQDKIDSINRAYANDAKLAQKFATEFEAIQKKNEAMIRKLKNAKTACSDGSDTRGL